MSYVKTQWVNGDTITADKLNHIEAGIEANETENSLLKSHLEAIETASDYVLIPVNVNKSINTNSSTPILPANIGNESGWCCCCVACSPGDVFGVTGKGGSGTRLWAFSDSTGARLSQSGSSLSGTDVKLIAPANAAYFAYNSQTNVPHNVYKGQKPNIVMSELGGRLTPLPIVAAKFTAAANKAHSPINDQTITDIKSGDKYYLEINQTGNREYRRILYYADGTTDTGSWWSTQKLVYNRQTASKAIVAVGIEVTNSGAESVFTIRVAQNPYGLDIVNPINTFDASNFETVLTVSMASSTDTTDETKIEPGLYLINLALTSQYALLDFYDTSTNVMTRLRPVRSGLYLVSFHSRVVKTRVRVQASGTGQTFTLLKVKSTDLLGYLADIVNNLPTYDEEISVTEFRQGIWQSGGTGSSNSRVRSAELYPLCGTFKVSLPDYTNYRFTVTIFDKVGNTSPYDTGWLSSDYTFTCGNMEQFGVNVKRANDSAITPADAASLGVKIIPQYPYHYNIVTAEQISKADNMKYETLYKCVKPCYDHLFQNESPTSIPPESLHHVRISRRMGFNMIEANTHKTSDDVYVVTHGVDGKFGPWFHSVDGQTDVPNTLISSVTWDWIVANVRYDSTIAKYRTRPPRLEEFLSECKQQNLIPFIQTGTDANIIAIADEIMGKNNYVAYAANRTVCPDGIIYQWRSESTLSNILAYCEQFGTPMIYGMSNPTDFTDSELHDIANALHKKGYLLGTGYADASWSRYRYLGFDILAAGKSINRIEYGNIANVQSMTGFSGFTVTNASEADGVLTFTDDGTITPNMDSNTHQLCGVDIEILFDGSITIPAIGLQQSSLTYTSDGDYPVFVSIPIINGSPKKTISVADGTVIYDLSYKVSEF